jgi:hypothetical protein
MQEAMDRLQEEQNATTTSKPDILEYLAFSTYMQGIEQMSSECHEYMSRIRKNVEEFLEEQLPFI